MNQRDLRTRIHTTVRLIARLKAKPKRDQTIWASTLLELQVELAQLERLKEVRRRAAHEKVVDLLYWRDGPWIKEMNYG